MTARRGCWAFPKPWEASHVGAQMTRGWRSSEAASAECQRGVLRFRTHNTGYLSGAGQAASSCVRHSLE